MGQYLNQKEERSELQQKIAAELRAKALAKSKNEGLKVDIDGIDDSNYIEGTKKTTSLGWVWLLIVLATIGLMIAFIVITMNQNASL